MGEAVACIQRRHLDCRGEQDLCPDIDPRHGGDETLDRLLARHGKLPETVRSLTPGGGEHILLEHPGFVVRNDSAGKVFGPGIDIRGDDGFIVGPRSGHRNGRTYEWEASSSPGEVPVARAPEWMRERLRGIYRETEDTDDIEDTEAAKIASASPRLCLSLNTLEDAIALTLPTAEGQRNRKIFDFARALKSVESHGSLPLVKLKPAVRAWHAKALAHLGTKDFDTTWADFGHAWSRVRTPLGCEPLNEAMARADAAPLPPVAEQYDRQETRRLVKLCRELQRVNGDSPFFISCRVAGEKLAAGVDNHELDCLVGCAVAGSMQGAVLFGTESRVRVVRQRVKLSDMQKTAKHWG